MTTKTDERDMVNRILDHLNEDPRVDSAFVKVDASARGTVTLRGTVPTFAARRAAEESAKAVAGVKRVQDFLVVPMPDPADFTHPQIQGDEGMRARINQYLRGQDILDPTSIDVIVEDGVVTLRGSVNAYWKRSRVEELVLGVDGVDILNTYLTVVPDLNMSDKIIAELIVEGMEENFFIEPQTVDIKVNRGLVTLRGSVTSRQAKKEAFEIALYTEGVIDVRDELIIQPL